MLPRVTPAAQISPVPVMDGNPVTGEHGVNNPSGASLTARVQRGLFHDANSNGQLDAGEIIETNTDEATFSSETHSFGTTVRDVSLGEFNNGRICSFTRILSVDPGQVEGSDTAVSCTVIGKTPYIQISGGDVIARRSGALGGDIVTNHVRIGTRTHGSWGEYGLIAPGGTQSASGGVLTTQGALTSSPDRTALTFANAGAGSPGGFTQSPSRLTEDSIMQFANGWSETSVAASEGRIGQGVLNAEPPLNPRVFNLGTSPFMLNFGSGASNPGAINQNLRGSYIIKSDGIIRIDNNIIYDDGGEYSSPANMPQVIIIADRIHIQPGVDRIDAWLIAREGISTCGTNIELGSYYEGLSRNHSCNQKLTINGMTQTAKLLLRRVEGAEGNTSEQRQAPAEVFNGRSDAYIWAQGRAAGQGTIRTETVRELPPRF